MDIMEAGEPIKHGKQNVQSAVWPAVIDQPDGAASRRAMGDVDRMDAVQHHRASRPWDAEPHDEILHLPVAHEYQPVEFPPAAFGKMLHRCVAGRLMDPQDPVFVLSQPLHPGRDDLKLLQQRAGHAPVVEPLHGGFGAALRPSRDVRDFHQIKIIRH